MKSTQFVHRAITTVVAILFLFGMALSQNLVIQSGASFTGTGTYKVKGNIDNSANSSAVQFGGLVRLTGTTAQDIGASGGGTLRFGQLTAQGNSTKTMIVGVTVDDSLTIDAGTGNSLAVGANTLNIDGTSGIVSGTLDASNASSTVNYRSAAASQVVLGQTYGGTLGMSGVSTKTLSAIASTVTLSHAGGALTVNNNLTVSGASTIGTLADVSTGKALTLGTTATITTVTTNTGTINGGTGLTTISTLSGNTGTISGAAGGGITFTNAATNGGTITGGAGLVTFSNTLAHSTGTITAGSGGVKFDNTVTTASGTITAGTGASLDINANVDNSGTSAISLTGTGTMTMAGNFTTGTGLSFASGSTVTFDGGSQNVPSTTFGVLTMSGTGTKTAQGNITVAGAFTNNVTTAMVTYTLTPQSTKTNTGTMQFAGETNGILFTDGIVEYNGTAAQAAAGQTVALTGSGSSYNDLRFSSTATKKITGGIVRTASGLTIATGVPVDVASGAELSIVSGNLTNAGTITNSGTITVGE